MKPSPARQAKRRKALRRTMRDLMYLLPLAVVYWAVTGATMGSAAWAALWIALIAVGHFGINYQYERRRPRQQAPTMRRRQPRLRARKIAGASSQAAAHTHDAQPSGAERR